MLKNVSVTAQRGQAQVVTPSCSMSLTSAFRLSSSVASGRAFQDAAAGANSATVP